MTRKILSLLLAALMLAGGCALAQEGPITVQDMMGRTITLNEPATRVVALTAADCEILCALGAENVLVGRGAYCDYPASVLHVPAVESGAETNVEQILALEPQVVLMASMAQSKEGVEALEKAGVAVVVSNAQNLEGVYTAMTMIGQLTGKAPQAEALIADMKDTLAAIAAQAENTGKTVYFEASPLQWGLWAAGKNTFSDELARCCGLTNAFSDVDGWAAISQEQVLARDPDYIISIAGGEDPAAEIKGRAGWESLRAIENDQVWAPDPDIFSRPGPRLKDAALALFQYIQQ